MRVLLVVERPYGAEAHDNVLNKRSLAAGALASVRSGLDQAGHSVDVVDLAAEDFNPVMSADEVRSWRTGTPMGADVTALQERLSSADHLVLVFLVWWMSMPASTKGFLDRVLTKGYAYEEPKIGGVLSRRLHKLGGVSVVSVMSTDNALYHWWFARPTAFSAA